MKLYKKLLERAIRGEVDDVKNALVNHPHYYIAEEKLVSLSGVKELDQVEVKYKELSMPHEVFLLNISEYKEYDNVGIMKVENVYVIKENPDCLTVDLFTQVDMPGPDRPILWVRVDICEKYIGPTGNPCNYKNLETNAAQVYPDLSKDDYAQLVDECLSEGIGYHLSLFDKALSRKSIRQGTERRPVSIKIKKKRKVSNITLIHLESKKYIDDGSVKNKNIEWSHSWKVRGHWRYLSNPDTLGKNRKGERLEIGRTWIMPHDKQKHLEYIQKTRVFK